MVFSGFAQGILFDDRKNPYHLMLRDLVNAGGLSAFFKTFEWLVSDGGIDRQAHDESLETANIQAEFLDAWLSLLERMVNPKMVLETPHIMAPKSNSALGYIPFDAIQYLITVHKRAFNAIDYLWVMHSKKCFSDQTSDHILSILCHLLKGEAIINEHLRKEKERDNSQGSTSGVAHVSAASNATQSMMRSDVPEVNPDHLQSLTDMGFAREAVIDALTQCQTIEQATEFLLSTPQASYSSASWANRAQESSTQDVDMTTEETSESKSVPKPIQPSKPAREEPLSKARIDVFTDNILPGSLRLMDERPSTVYRVCDLILTVAMRNGDKWCSEILKNLLDDIIQNSERLLELAEPLRAKDKKSVPEWLTQMRDAPEASKVAVRVHLYSLLFDEMKIQCANLLHECNALDCLISLLEVGLQQLLLAQNYKSTPSSDYNTESQPPTVQTPKWLAQTILLIDLFEKGAIASHRRAPLLNNKQRSWLYFDERSGRWTPHMSISNKIIDDAYKNGEQYARYSVGRKHYLAQFSSMLQINEDTSNLRPIMMSVKPLPDGDIQDEKTIVPIVPGLREHQTESLIKTCVGFIQLPIDIHSLQAVMRLTFRLTRDYERAVMFAQRGGVRALQNLSESSQFTGFVSLATLIIRHVLEEPPVLSQTMEKVIRSTTQHCQHNQREMHYLLRVLGSAACRNEEIFKKLAIEILRIAPMPISARDDDETRSKPDGPQIIKLLPAKTSSEPIKPSAVTKSVITDLLDSLTIPIQLKINEQQGPVRFATSPASPVHSDATKRIGDIKLLSPSSNDPNKLMDDPPQTQPRQHNPLLNHSIVLRLLAELSRSYSVAPKIIAEHIFTPATNETITEEVSALAFILDNILPTTQTHSDRDGPALARVFLASLAACNHCIEAQIAVVGEVKASLNRAASMLESCEKHARLQSLATMIGTMIDCCPSISSQQSNPRQNSSHAQHRLSNNIVRLFVRKGLVTDLARIPHSLDLSAPHMFATINAILKPLETLSRFVNLPNQSNQAKHHAPPAKKACSSSSSSSDIPDESATPTLNMDTSGIRSNVNQQFSEGQANETSQVQDDSRSEDEEEDEEEDNGEVSGVDEREEDPDDDDDDEDDDDDDDEDHVDDDDDHVDDDEADDDENLNVFGDGQLNEDFRIYNGHLMNHVLNDIEEVFLQQNVIYSERINNLLPPVYDNALDQHETAAPSLPPPPGNVGLTHPLLLRRLDPHGYPSLSNTGGAPPVISRAHRYGRPRLLRGAPGSSSSQWHGGSATRHPPQTILQQLLGPNTVQEVMTLTNQIVGPGRFFVADFHNWLAADEELYTDSADPHSLTTSHSTALATIPLVMARWTEESRILDGGTLHDCLTNVKQDIVEALERFKEEENQERQEKRKKMIEDDEQAQQKKCREPQAPMSVVATSSTSAPHSNVNLSTTQTNSQDPAVTPVPVSSLVPSDQPLVSGSTSASSQAQAPAQVLMTEPEVELTSDAVVTDQASILPSDTPSIAQVLNTEPEIEPSPASQPAADAVSAISESTTATSSAAVVRADLAPADMVTTNSGTSQEAPASNSESEIPDGVDPSFLAALPEDIRQEVLAEQWRLRRIERANNQAGNSSTQTNEQASTSTGNAAFPEVNPEFLAALPAEVQEEVLAQQRAEQQRQAALNSNPDQPVDPANFIQTLAPNLRRQVLADMDDSLLSLLPTDLAAEAQALRRELITNSASANSTLSRLLRTAAAGRMQRARYTITSVPDHMHSQPSWSWALDRPGASLSHGGGSNRDLVALTRDSKFKGRQLLDCEALTCLVILLFVEEPRLNIARLHRVIRNLSYHPPTRQWVVQSMLSIIDRAKTIDDHTHINTPALEDKRVGRNEHFNDLTKSLNHNSSWLSISMDAALGCRASVFSVRNIKQSAVSSAALLPYSGRNIAIHSQAAPSVCRHMLEALIALAKSFPQHFFPEALQSNDDTANDNEASIGSQTLGPEFWEILAKLDSFMNSLNKKSRARQQQQQQQLQQQQQTAVTNPSLIDGSGAEPLSPLSKLIGFLAHPIIKKSFTLTDRLLHLLAVISLSFPRPAGSFYEVWSHPPPPVRTPQYARRSHVPGHLYYGRHGHSHHRPVSVQHPNSSPLITTTRQPQATNQEGQTGHDTSSINNQGKGSRKPAVDGKPKQPLVTKPYLKLAVDVLTSKSCSEEGLDDVTSLLSRLSKSCPSTRATVLELLMDGARQLGHTVCQHISTLKQELQDYNCKLQARAAAVAAAEGASPNTKGIVQDRFTNDSVIITAPASSKTGREVQLPSMAVLTSKNSSQAFFLRILKVIIQLRDAPVSNMRLNTPAQHQTNRTGSLPQNQTTAGPETNSTQESLQQQSTPALDQPAMDVDVTIGASDASETPAPSTANAVSKSEEVSIKCEESLSIELQLERLWETLSQCLLELAETPDHHAVLVLQPAVEAFFLVHSPGSSQRGTHRHDDNSTEKNNQTSHIDQEVAPISPTDGSNPLNDGTYPPTGLSYDTQKFLKFAETHRVVLNHILRQSTTPLSQGPFAVLVDHTRVLDFDVKRRYFRQELERLDEGIRRDDLGIHVRRDHVFEESFRELHRRQAEDWKNRFFVVFEDEEGQDAGGLLREWYTIISREIFNPMYALFTTSPGDRVTYMINSASHCNTNHLTYFKFVGRVIAKAIYDNKLLDCYFTRSFYKHILGKPVKYTDMESEDYSFYQGLVFLLEHDVKELGYELTFSVEVREFGVTEVRELKPGGVSIPVTEENKHEYVRLVCQEKMTGSIRKQLSAFLEGFYDIIPKRLISIFNEQELELLISGLPNIDIEDLKASTEYHKYLPNSLQIQWFWRALRSFDQADRAKLLQFVTGTSKVPLQGFASLEGMNGVQKFQIHRDERSTDRLPSAHTCFNQLDLPVYETYDKLRYMLLKAIQECSEGFGLA